MTRTKTTKKTTTTKTTTSAPASVATAQQTLPMLVCRYFRKLTPSGKKAALTYTSMPYKFRSTRGQRPEHVTTRRVRAGTSLPDVLQAIAKTLGRSVDQTYFTFTTMAIGRIKIGAHQTAPYRAGRIAYVEVDDLVSPLPWRKVDDEHFPWRTLPKGLNERHTYSLATIRELFTADELNKPWRWAKPAPRSEQAKATTAAMKLVARIIKDRRVTVAEVAKLDAYLSRLRAQRATSKAA
jgi:hypothetical protein